MLPEVRSGLRAYVRLVWISVLYYSGLIGWAARRIAAAGGVIVLTFHRVLEDADADSSNSPPGMVMRRKTFVALAQFLSSRFVTVDLNAATRAWPNSKSPRFVVTFDDGWLDTATVAFPVTNNRKIPITVFVCPGLEGKENPFWPERVIGAWRAASASREAEAEFAQICEENGLVSSNTNLGPHWEDILEQLKAIPPAKRDRFLAGVAHLTSAHSTAEKQHRDPDRTMDWKMIEELHQGGVLIGSHTQTHPILTTVSSHEAAEELNTSKMAIESALHGSCQTFAYPNGSWSEEVRHLTEQAGYSLAFANSQSVWTEKTNRWSIPRVNLWEGSVTGPDGAFSPIVFQYVAIWRSFMAFRRESAGDD